MNRVDKRRVRESFSRAAPGYDASAPLQREVGRRVIERLEWVRKEPRRILDVGAGTGVATAALVRRYRRARVTALDLALPMLHHARRQMPWWMRRVAYVGADAEALPLTDASFDLVFSNLTVQWCGDLAAALGEFLRVLRPGGLLMFTTFGPDTLKELRASWAAADGGVHVNDFLDMHDVGDLLLAQGFAEPVMDREDFTLTYTGAREVMQDLKAIGAHSAAVARPRGLMGKQAWRRVQLAYEQWRLEGRLPATYEVIYGHAWAPQAQGAPEVTLGSLRGSGRSSGA